MSLQIRQIYALHISFALTVHTLSACSPCMSICALVFECVYLKCVRMCAALFFNAHEHSRRRRRCRRRCSAGLFCFLERHRLGKISVVLWKCAR